MDRVLLRIVASLGLVLVFTPLASGQDEDAAKARVLEVVRARQLQLERQQVLRLQLATETISKSVQPRRPGAQPLRFIRSRTLSAEQADEVLNVGPAVLADNVLVFDEPENVQIQPRAVTRLSRTTFDRWLFGNMTTEKSRQEWLEALLDEQIAPLARKYHLTVDQQAKLRLAGQGDIKRFFGRAEEKRLGFEEARKEIRKGLTYLNNMDVLCSEFEFGPFRDQSLFGKIWAKMLSDLPIDLPPVEKPD